MPSGLALTARWMITTVEPCEPMVATTVVAAHAAGAAEMADAVNVTRAAHIIAMTGTIREGSRAIIEVASFQRSQNHACTVHPVPDHLSQL